MIRILIVDDEPFIRQGLSILIDWKKEGFEIVGEAANGREALKKLGESTYDLIIADIKMPEMDGMELIKRVRNERLSEAEIILLTGHSEFEYARMAIQYEVLEYILKPIQKEELLRILRIMKERFDTKRNNKEKLKSARRMEFERHMTSLIWGKYDEINLNYVEHQLPSLVNLRYINVELDSYDEKFCGLNEEVKRKAQRQLYERCSSFLGDKQLHCIFDVAKHENCYDVGIIYSKLMSDSHNMEEREFLEYFLKSIQSIISFQVIIHVGQKVESIRDISNSYKTAMVAKTLQLFNNNSNKDIAYYEETEPQKLNVIGDGKKRIDAMLLAIEENDQAAIEEHTTEFYHNILSNNLDYQMINLNINYLLYRLLYVAKEQDEEVDQEEVLKVISQGAFDQIAVRGSLSRFKKFIYDFTEYLTQMRQNRSRGVIKSIEKEVEQHYMDNISLKELSEKYYINSAYLGQLFRKQFGQSFKEYLNRYRIDRAAELLLRTNDKIYVIAEKVGYHNLDYFINKFVENKGKTPLQYRKHLLKQCEDEASSHLGRTLK